MADTVVGVRNVTMVEYDTIHESLALLICMRRILRSSSTGIR